LAEVDPAPAHGMRDFGVPLGWPLNIE